MIKPLQTLTNADKAAASNRIHKFRELQNSLNLCGTQPKFRHLKIRTNPCLTRSRGFGACACLETSGARGAPRQTHPPNKKKKKKSENPVRPAGAVAGNRLRIASRGNRRTAFRFITLFNTFYNSVFAVVACRLFQNNLR